MAPPGTRVAAKACPREAKPDERARHERCKPHQRKSQAMLAKNVACVRTWRRHTNDHSDRMAGRRRRERDRVRRIEKGPVILAQKARSEGDKEPVRERVRVERGVEIRMIAARSLHLGRAGRANYEGGERRPSPAAGDKHGEQRECYPGPNHERSSRCCMRGERRRVMSGVADPGSKRGYQRGRHGETPGGRAMIDLDSLGRHSDRV